MDTAPFSLAHSNQTKWQQACDDCLQQLEQDENANLAFIYLTDGFAKDLGKILRYLKEHSQIKHWVGSVGAAVNCTNTEYYDQAAMVMMLTDFSEDSFTVFNHAENQSHLFKSDNDPYGMSARIALIHGDPRNGQMPELLQQLPEQIGNGYLIGGLSSSEQNFYYQIADDICEGQLSGVVFDESIQIATGVTQGCSPIGQAHVLTECDSHMAISIDNRPALDVFKEDIGEVLAKDINRAAGYIFAGFPIQGSDTGDYLVRNIIGIDPEHNMLAIGDHMKPDSPMIFCRRDGRTAIKDMHRMLEDLKQRMTTPPKGGVYISCMGRGQHLFGDDSQEMKIISEVLGDIPIVGFYANGEIAGQNLYGYTGILTLFM
jgi:small ligand-binding sensory domain FIST